MTSAHDKARHFLQSLPSNGHVCGLQIRTGPVSRDVKGESARSFYRRHTDAPDVAFEAVADCSSTASKDDGAAAMYPLAHGTQHLGMSSTAYCVADLSCSNDAESDAESASHSTAKLFSSTTAELAAHSITAPSDSSDDESHAASLAYKGSTAAVLAARSLADPLSDSSDTGDEAVSGGQLNDGSAEVCAAHSMAHLNGKAGGRGAARQSKSAITIRRRLHRLKKGFCAQAEATPAPSQRWDTSAEWQGPVFYVPQALNMPLVTWQTHVCTFTIRDTACSMMQAGRLHASQLVPQLTQSATYVSATMSHRLLLRLLMLTQGAW